MNFFEFYNYILNTNFEKQFALVIAIISGLISLTVSLSVFGLGRYRDTIKENKRIEIERLNLYNAIKFLNQAAISQLKTNNEIINEINENLSIPNGQVHFKDIQINSDIKAYSLQQIKSEDISKILIHQHTDEILDRSYYHHLLLENIPLGAHMTDSLMLIQTELHSEMTKCGDRIMETYTQIRSFIIKEISLLEVKIRSTMSSEEILRLRAFVDIQNIIVDFFDRNQNRESVGLEEYNEIALTFFNRVATLKIHEILNLCSIIFNSYAEVRVINRRVRENLLIVNNSINNIKDTCENIQKLEFPEKAQDFLKLKKIVAPAQHSVV